MCISVIYFTYSFHANDSIIDSECVIYFVLVVGIYLMLIIKKCCHFLIIHVKGK